MNTKILLSYISLLMTLMLAGCSDYLDITPVGQVIPGKTSEYRALINSAYKAVPNHKILLNMRSNQFDPQDDPWGMGLDMYDTYRDIYTWNDGAGDPKTMDYPYISFYQSIFYTNEIINNGEKATQDTEESMNQIMGEAYTLRAYNYFELVNMYAVAYDKATAASVKAVPINTTIDIEQKFPKATLQAVYDLILSDLNKAESLMDVERQEGENKYRFSIESLYGLKSRVYLYMKDWQNALDYANKALAINNNLEDMNSDDYKKNTDYRSKEAMVAIENVLSMELRDYAAITNDLLDLYKSSDLRRSKYFVESWMGYMIADKCTNTNELVTFRRAELYLNASEAAANLNKNAEAKQLLSTLMKKRYTSAGYSAIMTQVNGLSGVSLVSFILEERTRELALEGHQWYDWKRTTQPEITKTVKGEQFTLKKNDPRYVLQIPKSAREANIHLND